MSEKSAPQDLDALSEIQRQFALVRVAGTVYVVDRYALSALNVKGNFQKFSPIKRSEAMLLIRRVLVERFPGSNPKEISQEFFDSPKTTCYLDVEVNPSVTSNNTLNLWIPPSIQPKPGKTKLIRDFLENIICAGNKKYYNYLMRYIAHALQCPSDKPGVMIILLGGQGVGKGTLGRILQAIWGAMYLQIHQIKSIVGDFNSVLERSYIVWLDEAFFDGNRSATDSLKSLVTENLIHVNEKFQPARQVRSFHRFFGASNADFYKITDRDDRRDFVLRVSDARKGDHKYWNALNDEIENGGIEALVHLFMKADLSTFNVRNKPHTNELMRQKLKSLGAIEEWWHTCLAKREILHGDGWPEFLSSEDAVQLIAEYFGSKPSSKPSALEVANRLAQLCPSSHKKQMTRNGIRQRGFVLPGINVARSEFASYMGGKIDW